MKVVLDTNILVSGMFWSAGPPRKILQAWLNGRFQPVVTSQIVEEYREVVKRISSKRNVDGRRLLERLLMQTNFVLAPDLRKQICSDRDDDMFISAALSGRAKFIVTGDRALLAVRHVGKIQIVSAAAFLSVAKM